LGYLVKKLLRYIAIAAGFVLLALIPLFAVAWWKSNQEIARTYALADVTIAENTTPAAIERGAHLAQTRGCAGDTFAGTHMINAGPVMQIHAPNITMGGVLAEHDLASFEHALRHAVGRDGRGLLLMPSEDYAMLSNEDVAALFAFLERVPPREDKQLPSTVGPLGRMLYLFGKLPIWKAAQIDHASASRGGTAPVPAVTVAYGAYVAQGCVSCHGQRYVGGKVPGTPPDFKPASNLTRHSDGLANWSEADFLRAMRTGKRPDGTELDSFMPWQMLAKMDDTELRAIWLFLRSLPAEPTPTR
jgi:cytochrome c553